MKTTTINDEGNDTGESYAAMMKLSMMFYPLSAIVHSLMVIFWCRTSKTNTPTHTLTIIIHASVTMYTYYSIWWQDDSKYSTPSSLFAKRCYRSLQYQENACSNIPLHLFRAVEHHLASSICRIRRTQHRSDVNAPNTSHFKKRSDLEILQTTIPHSTHRKLNWRLENIFEKKSRKEQ